MGITVDTDQSNSYDLNVIKVQVPQNIYHNGATNHNSKIHTSVENAIFPDPLGYPSHSAK